MPDKVINTLEKERLTLTIQRIDHYYDSVNNKSAVYIAINTFLIGGIIALVSNPEVSLNLFSIYTTGLCLITGIGNLILLAITSRPFFSTKPESQFYFGSISSKTLKEFSEISKNYNSKDELEDLRSQVYILSKGLTRKFKRLNYVGITLVIQFFLLIPIIIFIISKV